MFRRYSDPLGLMRTYTLEGLAGFIIKLFNEENESQLWEIWLHKDIDKDFGTFKKEQISKSKNKAKYKQLSKDEEQQNIENAMRFIKPKKGGETIK